ncbi:hypothetical protein ACIQAC_12875 [Streptomyces sp. NPDC088387]|uniref:hypothetical protein n=1 Tax=Streptomyces sp. NPDC088387 TaxID=3365859 RepID=UPI003819D0BC
MNPGERFWNEETQRWEDGGHRSAQVTPPPPPRPEQLPPHGTGTPWVDEPWRIRPAAPPPSGRWEPPRIWAAVVVAAAVVGVTVALVVVQSEDGDSDGKGGAQAGESVSATGPSPDTLDSDVPAEGSVDPYATPDPVESVSEPPYGYQEFTDPQGFRIAVPDGWTREAIPSEYGMDVVNFRSPYGDQRIQVFEVAEATPDESFALFLSPDTPKAPGFQQLALDQLVDADVTGARLEYLVDSIRGEPDVGTWHVVDARFTTPDGSRYAIAAYGSDDDGREDEVELVTTGVDWFCAPGAVCA